jgi:hypothetical protein
VKKEDQRQWCITFQPNQSNLAMQLKHCGGLKWASLWNSKHRQASLEFPLHRQIGRQDLPRLMKYGFSKALNLAVSS